MLLDMVQRPLWGSSHILPAEPTYEKVLPAPPALSASCTHVPLPEVVPNMASLELN